ncbi:MAG: radical SAM protein [Methanoregula sp.]|jgi:MoaA/NifB/PqqE/SkfB family radical SAM enzyme|nr:radical SAM protein [Methanoregula sp.]
MKRELTVRNWHWEITKDCNLKCLHCIFGGCGGQEMTTQDSLRVISRIVQLGGKTLRLTGGEPLMRKDLGLIIQEAHASGLGLDLITNGTMLDDVFLRKYGRYIKHMAISIDGQKQVHEYLRGKGTYEKSIQSTRKAMDAGIDLSVYVTIHSLNENSLDLLMEELISIGVGSFHFNEINMEGRASKNRYLLLGQEKTSCRLDRILSQFQKIADVGHVSHDSGCSISSDSVYLASDGRIYACVEIAFKSPEQKIAHILDQEIEGKMSRFFSEVAIPRNCICRYALFSMQGISVLLNESENCPILKERRVDNEQSSA